MSDAKRPILVYVTEQERNELEAKARNEGRTLSAQCRWMLLKALRPEK